jgi:hypothetical protein
MTEITLTLDPAIESKGQEEILAAMEREVEIFSTFMENLADWRAKGALSAPEKTLIKTYLVHKFRGRINGTS